MEHLTKETFLKKVFDFEKNKEWKFEGELPCLIDFYADWCQPCKMVAPILEELSEEYKGKINIYKVDTEAERELARQDSLALALASGDDGSGLPPATGVNSSAARNAAAAAAGGVALASSDQEPAPLRTGVLDPFAVPGNGASPIENLWERRRSDSGVGCYRICWRAGRGSPRTAKNCQGGP